MKNKLFDYIEKDNFIYNLSGLTKLICFILLTFSVMFTYDIRSILFILVLSLLILISSGIKFSQVKLMFIYVFIFMLLNSILTFVFDPLYGTEIYGTYNEIYRFNSYFIVTQEELFYLITKFFKYISVVPLGIIFFLTTNPSEFAASLNKIGLSYKVGYSVSLTLRYFPEMISSYTNISLAQQSRGLDLSKKEKLFKRIKNIMFICVPLVLSTLDKIELVSNAMDLRSFGKNKKRTWYASKKINKKDILSILFCAIIFIGILYIALFIIGGRFYNPFK